MAKYRVAVIGTVGKSVLIDDSLSSRVAKLETQIATTGGVTRHSALTGLQQGNDHPQYTMWQAPETIAAPWNFSVIPFIQGETLAEYIEDVVAGGTDPFISDSPSVTWTYDDTGNNLQADVVDEYIEDLVGSMLVNTTYIDLDYGDSDGSIKAILYTDAVLDLVGGGAFQDSSTIDFTYDSGTKRTSAAVVQSFSYSWTGNHTFTPASGNTKIHAGNLQLDVDNLELQLGASQDFRFYHDGTNSNITNDTGLLLVNIVGGTSGLMRISASANPRVLDINSNATNGPFVSMNRSGVQFGFFGNAAQLFSGGDLDGIGFVTANTSALELGTNSTRRWRGTNDGHWRIQNGALCLLDGITAPSTVTGFAAIYVDTADGDLKVKFSDGTVKTIVTDT